MFQAIFVAHPRARGESYGCHMRHALRYAATLFGAGCAAAIHGLVPCLFETTASRAVARLHGHMAVRLQKEPV